MLYSSVASLFGNIGQTNYSAANAYLDELARWRVSQGLAAVSVQWPAVSGVGMAAAMDEGVKIDDKLSVGEGTVKQVVKQLFGSMQMAEPVQAVVPRGLLEPGIMSDRAVGSLLSQVQVRLDRLIYTLLASTYYRVCPQRRSTHPLPLYPFNRNHNHPGRP